MDQALAVQILVVPVIAIAVAAVARRMGWSSPLVLVLVGLVLSPLVPGYQLDPNLILLVFLPPLLYSAAIDSSYLRLKAFRSPVALLSIGLVLFTTLVIGWVVHLLMPELPLAAAFALGAIVAPPDAVAAVAVARGSGCPAGGDHPGGGEPVQRRHRAHPYRVAIAAALGQGAATWRAVTFEFPRSAVGGVLIGARARLDAARVLLSLRDALVENTVLLLIPFALYFVAETCTSPA